MKFETIHHIEDLDYTSYVPATEEDNQFIIEALEKYEVLYVRTEYLQVFTDTDISSANCIYVADLKER
jgi:hypothetical protein